MKTFLAWTAAALGVLLLIAFALSLWVSRPLFDGTLDAAQAAGAPVASTEALSFARYRDGAALRLLLVQAQEGDGYVGVDLGRALGRELSDPLALLRELDADAILRASAGAPRETVATERLVLPFDAPAHNIGIGANYREHARESGLEEQPFVFPKRAAATPWNSPVAKADALLLDYEVELGFVALEDLVPGMVAPRLGLVLCNELTDRGALVRHFHRDTPMGTSGFVEGKSREGFAVLGPLLVVPRDLAAFYPAIELALAVNGRLRQRERAGAMVWGPQRMLEEIFRRETWTFHERDGTTPLLPRAGTIPAGTVIFSGTPPGVIFKPLNLWNPWVYLRPGDEVTLAGSGLGTIRNRIVR